MGDHTYGYGWIVVENESASLPQLVGCDSMAPCLRTRQEDAMLFTLRETRIRLRNSVTRIPFRYGKSCLTACPQLVLETSIEHQGKHQSGFAGDCLPPGWFDKTPGKPFRQQIEEMLDVTRRAETAFRQRASQPTQFFPAWLDVYREVHSQGRQQGYQPLLTSFGVSLMERAIMDALARASGIPFAEAVRSNLYGIEAGEVHADLAGTQPSDWLPSEPMRKIGVRHTVGLGDPLTAGDIPPEERVEDGLPQSLEEYIQQCGLRYFKVKVSNQPDVDRQRLLDFASLVERHRGADYLLTLDGNEQYESAEQLQELIELLQRTPQLATLHQNILAIEQPLARQVALSDQAADCIRGIADARPVIIDESDGTLESYPQALELGYRGVSSKNCKGPVKSLLNAGLTWLRNGRNAQGPFLITGEDLCTVGIIPVQSDLCLVATLGLTHVERNGHHYHPGLSYLPAEQQEQALAAHGDFYRRSGGSILPDVKDGQFQLDSILKSPGCGFAAPKSLAGWQAPDEWSFESLGLAD